MGTREKGKLFYASAGLRLYDPEEDWY